MPFPLIPVAAAAGVIILMLASGNKESSPWEKKKNKLLAEFDALDRKRKGLPPIPIPGPVPGPPSPPPPPPGISSRWSDGALEGVVGPGVSYTDSSGGQWVHDQPGAMTLMGSGRAILIEATMTRAEIAAKAEGGTTSVSGRVAFWQWR